MNIIGHISSPLHFAVLLLAFSISSTTANDPVSRFFNVCDYGAVGDGSTSCTDAINRAVAECNSAGGDVVLFPEGRFLSGTIHLKSNITLKLESGARLIGTPDLQSYQFFTPPAGSFEAGFPKWHSALILGVGVENVSIIGPGVIDGNKVFNPNGEEKMRGPHTILFGRSSDIAIRDVSITDSANYAVMLEWCDRVDVEDTEITGGWDGVHFRGSLDRFSTDIRIRRCQFYTGDDSIAGRYVENFLVEDCLVNSSCNGMRIIGPMKHMIVHRCRFWGPGKHPHRTQDRYNMLAGIILQPGAWDPSEGPLEDVVISDISMENVAAPITIWLKRPGNTIDDVCISRLTAKGVYRAAVSVESWVEQPIGSVSFNEIDISYQGGGKAMDPEAIGGNLGVDSRALQAWAFYARNVDEISLRAVRWSAVEEDQRSSMMFDQVKRLYIDGEGSEEAMDGRKE